MGMRFYMNPSTMDSRDAPSGRPSGYFARVTVIGIAPLLNSIHAISIGSTAPAGTSKRIGDPMLICSARAPMIRAFSNRV